MKLAASALEPYTIDVPESILDDIERRLESTRWPQSPNLGWDAGTDANCLRELCEYWRNGYNWRNAEQALNRLPHYRTEIDGVSLHFV